MDIFDSNLQKKGCVISNARGDRMTLDRNQGTALINIAKQEANEIVFQFAEWYPRRKQGYYKLEIVIDGDVDGVPIRQITWKGYIRFQRYFQQNGNWGDSDFAPMKEIPDSLKVEQMKELGRNYIRYFEIHK